MEPSERQEHYFAGFGARLVAYLLDIIPITLAVILISYFFLGFNETWNRYRERAPGDIESRAQFLTERNYIRNISFLVYLAYCGVMEATALQGTLGKHLLGLRVVGPSGEKLSLATAAKRNLAKSVSAVLFGIGFLAVLWSKTRQGWHDRIANTYVTYRG